MWDHLGSAHVAGAAVSLEWTIGGELMTGSGSTRSVSDGHLLPTGIAGLDHALGGGLRPITSS